MARPEKRCVMLIARLKSQSSSCIETDPTQPIGSLFKPRNNLTQESPLSAPSWANGHGSHQTGLDLTPSRSDNVQTRRQSMLHLNELNTSRPAKRLKSEHSTGPLTSSDDIQVVSSKAVEPRQPHTPLLREFAGRQRMSPQGAVSAPQEYNNLNSLINPKLNGPRTAKQAPIKSPVYGNPLNTLSWSPTLNMQLAFSDTHTQNNRRGSNLSEEFPDVDDLIHQSRPHSGKRVHDKAIPVDDDSDIQDGHGANKTPKRQRLDQMSARKTAHGTRARPQPIHPNSPRLSDIHMNPHPDEISSDELAEGNDIEHQLTSSRPRSTRDPLKTMLQGMQSETEPPSPTKSSNPGIPHSTIRRRQLPRLTAKEAELERYKQKISREELPLREAFSHLAHYRGDDLTLVYDSTSNSFILSKGEERQHDFGLISPALINGGFYCNDTAYAFILLKGPRAANGGIPTFGLDFKTKQDEALFLENLTALSPTIATQLQLKDRWVVD
jgi:hypothetical protein